MTEAEAHDLILAYIELTHGYGESVWGQFQIWMGGSFALILTAHFAPERMNVVVTTFLAAVYVGFTWSLGTNMVRDLEFSGEALVAALELADMYGINTPLLDAYDASATAFGGGGGFIAASVFIVGLWIGCLGYLAHTSYKFHRT